MRISPLSLNLGFPCTQTFDVDLGALPEGGYSILFYVGVTVLASANFIVVGPVQIPAVSQGGIAILAIILALMAFVVDAKARQRADSKDFRIVLMLASAVIAGVLGSTSPAFAAEVANRGIATDLIVRFDRNVERDPHLK